MLCEYSEQLVHQLKLDEKQHEELLQQEKAKKMAQLQASLFLIMRSYQACDIFAPLKAIFSAMCEVGYLVELFSLAKWIEGTYMVSQIMNK